MSKLVISVRRLQEAGRTHILKKTATFHETVAISRVVGAWRIAPAVTHWQPLASTEQTAALVRKTGADHGQQLWHLVWLVQHTHNGLMVGFVQLRRVSGKD
jgi:hypothetical protein